MRASFEPVKDVCGWKYWRLTTVNGADYVFTESEMKSAAARGHKWEKILIAEDDILFECPACQHQMVCAVIGTVRCPGCGQSVIVPPKPPKK